MIITDVRITLLKKENNNACVGLASVTLEEVFAITNIRIMEGKNGMFVSMPARKTADGEYKDICFPVTKDFRQYLIDKVLCEYNAKYNKEKNVESAEDTDFPF